jgi:hypothetical protein
VEADLDLVFCACDLVGFPDAALSAAVQLGGVPACRCDVDAPEEAVDLCRSLRVPVLGLGIEILNNPGAVNQRVARVPQSIFFYSFIFTHLKSYIVAVKGWRRFLKHR